MEPYLSFLDSYPSSSSPLQLGVTKHQPDDDHHFMHHSNVPFLGLMADMEVSAASSSTSTLDRTSNSGGARDIGNKSLLDIGSSEAGKAKEMDLERPKTTASNKKMRKARYAFQTRSHVDILDDGYRWRKYGQKAVKNNKFPRSYYRCTFQGCNVKKQVQRLTKDEGVVVTTYEGIHSHPIEKSTDNFEHILSQFQVYPSV